MINNNFIVSIFSRHRQIHIQHTPRKQQKLKRRRAQDRRKICRNVGLFLIRLEKNWVSVPDFDNFTSNSNALSNATNFSTMAKIVDYMKVVYHQRADYKSSFPETTFKSAAMASDSSRNAWWTSNLRSFEKKSRLSQWSFAQQSTFDYGERQVRIQTPIQNQRKNIVGGCRQKTLSRRKRRNFGVRFSWMRSELWCIVAGW